MKTIALSILIALSVGFATYFFAPTPQDAHANSQWKNANYSKCIIDNLDKVHSDRAASLLDDYCLYTFAK